MKLLFAGDFCPINRIGEMSEHGDFSFFDELKTLTCDVDLSVVNLECPLLDGKGFKPIDKVGPNLSANSAAAKAMVYAGFDVAALANNHIKDYGHDGVISTISVLEQNGLAYVGAGRNIDEAGVPLLKNVAGKNVAIVNCCEHESSIADVSSAGANPIEPIRQYNQIRAAREKADYVVVITHGGIEKFPYPTIRMVDTYRFFIDAGADVVINHHQHCYSGYEIYAGKPIFYGLGNLCFDILSKQRQWAEGYMVELTISDGDTKFEIIPYEQCFENKGVHLLEKTAFNSNLEMINKVISDRSSLSEILSKHFSGGGKGMQLLFEPYSSSFFVKLWWHKLLPSFFGKSKRKVLLNKIECESHREKLLHYLRQE